MFNRLIILVTVCASCFGCSGKRLTLADVSDRAYYSTSYPREGRQLDLAEALPSVRMLSSVGFYRQANFSDQTGWPADEPVTSRIWQKADTITTHTQSVVGTGTLLQFSMNRIALLTSAHVITFDDTVTTYYYDHEHATGIRSLAVKVRQRNYVAEVRGADALEVLARDDRLDIAIVGQNVETRGLDVPVFPLPLGQAVDLTWGSFVYIVGYPVGMRMVSSGIVSQPMRDNDGSFLTDVVFNRGMSGAALLAAKSDSETLEWVGIVTSGSANTEYVLSPNPDNLPEGSGTGESYEGDVFVTRVQRIRYGVTMAVSIDAIRRFAAENRTALLRQGYRLNVLE